MRTLLYILASILLFMAVFWAGLVVHFPGAAVSRYIESRINQDPRLALRMSPAELKWNRITVERISLDTAVGGEHLPVAAFHGTEIPLSFALMSGLALRTASEGGGRLEAYWPWAEGEARIAAEGLRLEAIPAATLLEPARLTGEVTFTMTVDKVRDADGPLPTGRIRGRGEGLTLDQADVMGVSLPALSVEELGFQLKLGRTVAVEEVTLRGDVQGTVSGRINPVLEVPERSALQLDVQLAFRPDWIERWGDLTSLVKGYLDEGRLEGTLQGTPRRPLFRKARTRE